MSTNSSTGSSNQSRVHWFYLRVLGCCIFICLVALALFNLLVDPLGAYPATALKMFASHRGRFTSRAGKAEAVAHGPYDLILLGTSRVELGLPMNHPAYQSARVYNLALAGTSLPELIAALEFALHHNQVKRVIFGVDFLLFSDMRSNGQDFENSRFNPHLNIFEYHARNLFDWDATMRSWSMVDRVKHHRAPPAAERGFVPRAIPKNMTQRAVFARRIHGFLIDPTTYGNFHYSQIRLKEMREIIELCQRHKVELIIFIPPVHVLQLETVRVAGLWDMFEQWQRDAANIVAEESREKPIPFWDFTGFKGRVAEDVPPPGDRTTRMKWYIDSSHFTPALGDLVLDRLFNLPAGDKADDFGVPLTPANVEAHVAEQRTDREAYAAARPNEIEWVKHLYLHKDEMRSVKDAAE